MTRARSPGTVRETRRAAQIAVLLVTLALGLVVAACGPGSGASGAPAGTEPGMETAAPNPGY